MQDMRIKYPFMKTPLLFLTAMLIFAACDDYNELNNLDKLDYKNYQYKGAFALPIGNSILNLQDMGINMPEGWDTITNTEILNQVLDTIRIIKMKYVVAFDFKKIVNDISRVDSLTMRVKATNEFPSGIQVLITVANADTNFLDYITRTPLIIDSAKVTVNNQPPIPYIKDPSDVPFEKSQYMRWGDVKFIIISIDMENQNADPALYRNYKFYNVGIEMAFRIYFGYNTKDL
jgi:hypothetical protein